MKSLHNAVLLIRSLPITVMAALLIAGGLLLPVLAQSGGTLAYGSRVYGTVSDTAPIVSYAFNGAAGDFVTARAESWAGALDIHLDLVAPNGLILDSSHQNNPDAQANGAFLSVFLPDAGAYLLRISGENASTGDFLLVLLGRAAALSTPLIYGEPTDVTIPAQPPTAQYFTYETQACPTTLIVTNLATAAVPAFPYLIKVRDQRGQTVALIDGLDQQEEWITTAASSGGYEVEVSSADPTLGGSVRLLVACASSHPGCRSGVAGQPCPETACAACPSRDELVTNGGCPDVNLTAVRDSVDPGVVTVTWEAASGIDGYVVYVTGLISGGGETYLTHAAWTPGDPLSLSFTLPTAGYDGYRFTLHLLLGDETLCTQQTQVGMQGVPSQTVSPCAIRADREGVPVRVGPGESRAMFAYLNPGIEYTVIGQAIDEGEQVWWALDKTVFTGHEGVTSLWVAQSDVTPIGDCGEVPPYDVPPVIPIPDDDQPGQWLPCGSCSTCGHPAAECVTSPEGVCLWDPATCTSNPNPGGSNTCYAVATAVDLGPCYAIVSVVLDTPPNCQTGGGAYTPGTAVQAHITTNDSKCIVHSWSGCGASGSGPSTHFTPAGSCTLTAHMGY